MPAHTIILPGCTPTPLAHYLKALGILRLVSEQRDASAEGFWQRDVFSLQSQEFKSDDLLRFFLLEYQPTPIITPWNGGGGFFYREEKSKEKDADTGKLKKTGIRNQETAATKVIAAISQSSGARMAQLRRAIFGARVALDDLQMSEAPKDEAKAELLIRLRNTLSDEAVSWLDAVIVMTADRVGYPPLFGTGGTDGNLDFTNNFIQRLTQLFDPETGQPTAASEQWLRQALFASSAPGSTTKAPIGQFFPGASGGANSTSGFNGSSAVNPWDYVLMIEGSLLFAAAAVKKLEASDQSGLAWPFAVRSSSVGYGSASVTDQLDGKSLNEELWMPLWEKPTTLAELKAVFGEGRVQIRGRAARNGVDFAMAVVTLGVDRGITAFQRYGLLVRNGLSNFATPLERVVVRRNARADLLADIDQWLDRLRQKAGPQANPEAPASVSRALNQLERSILDLCRDDAPDRLQAVLIALGRAEQALANSFKWTTSENIRLRALHSLNPAWLKEAETNTCEFRLARALAGSRAWLGKETLWLRQHLEPLAMGANLERSWTNWDATPGNDVVWHEGDLTGAFNAILARRMIRVEKSGARGWPDWSPRPASLADITEFIEGRTDDGLLADLLWGLSLIDWEKIVRTEQASRREEPQTSQPWIPHGIDPHRAVPSSLYALLRLSFRRPGKDDPSIPLVPAIYLRSAHGQGKEASELAARRLRGSGFAPLVASIPVSGEPVRRTAAALLFPINRRDFHLLETTILHQPETTN